MELFVLFEIFGMRQWFDSLKGWQIFGNTWDLTDSKHAGRDQDILEHMGEKRTLLK